MHRPRLIALNKTDLLTPDFPRGQVIRAYRETGWRVFPVSAPAGEGLDKLKAAIWEEFPQPARVDPTD